MKKMPDNQIAFYQLNLKTKILNYPDCRFLTTRE